MLRGCIAGVLLVVVGCGGSVSVDKTEQSGQTTQSAETGGQAGAADAEACAYPAGVEAANLAADAGSFPVTGCTAGPPTQLCEVDGATTTCQPICPGSDYELTCATSSRLGDANSQPIPSPDPRLNCDAIRIPTPSNMLFYCCPCGG
jgi:hypothetical protein